jgi:hypothetical protein
MVVAAQAKGPVGTATVVLARKALAETEEEMRGRILHRGSTQQKQRSLQVEGIAPFPPHVSRVAATLEHN